MVHGNRLVTARMAPKRKKKKAMQCISIKDKTHNYGIAPLFCLGHRPTSQRQCGAARRCSWLELIPAVSPLNLPISSACWSRRAIQGKGTLLCAECQVRYFSHLPSQAGKLSQCLRAGAQSARSRPQQQQFFFRFPSIFFFFFPLPAFVRVSKRHPSHPMAGNDKRSVERIHPSKNIG